MSGDEEDGYTWTSYSDDSVRGFTRVEAGIWETESGIAGDNLNYHGPPSHPPPPKKKTRSAVAPIYYRSPAAYSNYVFGSSLNSQYPPTRPSLDTRLEKWLNKEFAPCSLCLCTIFAIIVGILCIKFALVDVKGESSTELVCDLPCAEMNSTKAYMSCDNALNEGIATTCWRETSCCDVEKCICKTYVECKGTCSSAKVFHVILLTFGCVCVLMGVCLFCATYASVKTYP